jgi:hypothetical protein
MAVTGATAGGERSGGAGAVQLAQALAQLTTTPN